MAPTDGLRLLHGTGDERVDEILRGTIALFEAAAPGRVAGYYLAGSYAEGTADSTSDIDLFYDLRVPPEALSPEEARRCLAVAESVDRISSIEIHPALAHAPVDWGAVRHGVHLYGEDRREGMPSPPPCPAVTPKPASRGPAPVGQSEERQTLVRRASGT